MLVNHFRNRFRIALNFANPLNSESIKTIPPEAFPSERKASGRLGPYIQLTKPRLSMMSVASAVFGYFAAATDGNSPVFVSLLMGTALAACGAAALNQWMEAREDGVMKRTSDRPIPSGEVKSSHALILGLGMSILGLAVLHWGTNPHAMLLTLGVLVSYLAMYTPMKKSSPLSTEVGAISGALPPLLGYVAATGSLYSNSLYGWILFGILFAWQMPHFMAISWMYRKDYADAGFKMLVHVENGFNRSARKSLFYTIVLIALSFSPIWIRGNDVSIWYLILNGILSAYVLYFAVRFLSPNNQDANARSLFFSTILYLPVFMLLFALDRYL